jgi:zinc transporter ZupT
MKSFWLKFFLGVALGVMMVVAVKAFFVGMEREAIRQEKLESYYCENYGACGGNNDK